MTDDIAIPGASEGARRAIGEGPGIGAKRGRMSARRKQAAVLRVLRGEDLDFVSRDLGVSAARLSGWRDAFLAAGAVALKSGPADVRDDEIRRLRAKVGELSMDKELLEGKIARLETGRPLARRRSRS